MDCCFSVFIFFLMICLAVCENNTNSWSTYLESHTGSDLQQFNHLNKDYSRSGCVEKEASVDSFWNVGLEENENVLAEGWVNANILNYHRQHELKSLENGNLHVSLDLKYLMSSNAEQPDSSGRMSSLNVWLTLLIVVVAAAILS